MQGSNLPWPKPPDLQSGAPPSGRIAHVTLGRTRTCNWVAFAVLDTLCLRIVSDQITCSNPSALWGGASYIFATRVMVRVRVELTPPRFQRGVHTHTPPYLNGQKPNRTDNLDVFRVACSPLHHLPKVFHQILFTCQRTYRNKKRQPILL
jgi:hypothetical protein